MSVENSRSTQSVIDLSREPDFHLGALLVSPSAREVTRGSKKEALEPRVMQVLVALRQAEGAVVSRDTLIARCWEGRIVGEDAISRAIWRLRRLSGADNGASFSIETIPRVGYRLSFPAGKDTSSGPRDGAPATEALPLNTGSLRPQQRWMVESSRPLIAAQALEGHPAFSSNGAMLAYASGSAWSRKIHVRNVARGDGIRITSGACDDVSPSWSSDGTRIAYVAQKKGEPCRIMVASVPAGEVREAARCDHTESGAVSWQPDTSFLYYSDRTGLSGDSIFRLDLETGARLQLAKEAGFWPIRHIQCSPDGKSLLYVKALNAAIDTVVIHDLASGKEQILGETTGGSATWSEDSRTVLASTASGIGSVITAYPVDVDAPYRVYAIAAGIGHLASGAGGMLALEIGYRREYLARATTSPASQPDIIHPANGRSWAPSFTPDGTLAFLSNRSSTNAIWVVRPGMAPALLFDAGLARVFRQEFSPDGTRLAVAIARPDGITMKILTADGAVVSSFDSPTLGLGHPAWTPDNREVILFDRIRGQQISIAIDNPGRRSRVADAPPWAAIAMRGDAVFASRIDMPGLWQIDGTPRLVTDRYPIRFDPPIMFRVDDVLIPDFNAAEGPRILAQPLDGGPDRVIAYAAGAQAQEGSFMSKMAVNPKTGEILYVVPVQSDTGIDLLSLAKR